MLNDPFVSSADSPTAPDQRCFEIVPDDVAELQIATKALYVGSAGDLTLVSLQSSAPVTFRNVPAGAILDIRVKKVLAASTTAADIIGLA